MPNRNATQPSLQFPDQPDLSPEIEPTWCEASDVYHITERCTRLQAIEPGRRLSGTPWAWLRLCFNCEDIVRAKRTG